ncbi:MAG TPA: prolyl oligopeptidase family serine peptidase [Micropepsaceae bacterium]|nr:prolyl oligopeptidase family serine peptidase [Micropepsaceae bacterium]
MPSHKGLVGLLAAALIAGSAIAAEVADDPYLWLEDIHGAKAVAWAEEQNEAAFKRLKSDSDYNKNYDAVLGVLDATDRIPMGQVYVSHVFNFWQDENHVRGLWRRTPIASYETPSPQWETLIDVDELARVEGKNWVFKRASCSLDLKRCLISLSLGGGDTVVLREFDPVAKRFMAEGFDLGESKAEAAYLDADTILFSTDFGKGTLTESGYPRIVKIWHRGEKIADAKIVYQGTTSDVIVSPVVFQLPSGPIALAARSVNYYETEYYSVITGTAVKLPLPESADVKTAIGDQLITTLRKEWVQDDGSTLPQGSLIAFPLKEFLATHQPQRAVAIYSPGPRATIDDVAAGRDAVYVAIFENVTGSVHAFKPDPATGQWSDTRLDVPSGGSTGIASANPFGPEAYFTYQGFLTPTTLYSARGEEKPVAIKSLPARFDASPYRQSQYEAISKDGTRIPYFVVRPRDAQGATPMVLYGYGGFEASSSPFYWTAMGRIWLPKGGAYAVANIRGGGEFGPAWHEAALKTNRQKAFDDFIAVAEDMVLRGLTTPDQLGILGGSNGGLLVGAVAVERPDLFGAVVCQVPLLDMIRYPKFGAGASWVAEYGDPENPEERAAILAYSPYQNVKPREKYPPIFFITATSDDRVTPVHARKMAAKMEAQGHNVLFYENTDGGHAAAANHAQQAEMNALSYVFFAQQLMAKP